jgi:hypothetical protein
MIPPDNEELLDEFANLFDVALPACRAHERPSLFNVKFQTLDGFEFWITPYNHIFLVGALTGQIFQPSLMTTGEVGVEPPSDHVPPSVLKATAALLEAQRKLRNSLHLDREDEETAWDWS